MVQNVKISDNEPNKNHLINSYFMMQNIPQSYRPIQPKSLHSNTFFAQAFLIEFLALKSPLVIDLPTSLIVILNNFKFNHTTISF